VILRVILALHTLATRKMVSTSSIRWFVLHKIISILFNFVCCDVTDVNDVNETL
jgi:hypothetical protein